MVHPLWGGDFRGGLGAKGGEWRVTGSQHLNANDIPPVYVISVSLWIKTSFKVMFKGCITIISLGDIVSSFPFGKPVWKYSVILFIVKIIMLNGWDIKLILHGM